MTELTRQHYRYALNESLDKPPKGPNPGYKKGGAVKAKSASRFSKGGSSPMRKGTGRGC